MRLVEPAVQPPRFARLDPTDRRRGDALFQQPDARVQGGLACADDDEASGRSLMRAISPAGTQRTPSATSNGGALVAGMAPSRYVVSTTFRRTRTLADFCASRETKRCSPT